MGKIRNRKPIDMMGFEFQTWKVTSKSEKKSSGNNTYWFCECTVCGNKKELCGTEIRLGRTGICKCQKQYTTQKKTGSLKSREYKPKDTGDMYFKTSLSDSSKIKNEIGNKYGKLLVTSFAYTKDSNAYWVCQCDCGKQTIARGNALRTGNIKSCGCQRSWKEQEIVSFLDNYEIEYIREYTFSDLRDQGLLRFDFAIFKNNKLVGLIEYQGSQHYDPNCPFAKDGLIQTHDDMKRRYCKIHNIPLLELNKNNNLEQDLLSWLNKIGE